MHSAEAPRATRIHTYRACGRRSGGGALHAAAVADARSRPRRAGRTPSRSAPPGLSMEWISARSARIAHSARQAPQTQRGRAPATQAAEQRAQQQAHCAHTRHPASRCTHTREQDKRPATRTQNHKDTRPATLDCCTKQGDGTTASNERSPESRTSADTSSAQVDTRLQAGHRARTHPTGGRGRRRRAGCPACRS